VAEAALIHAIGRCLAGGLALSAEWRGRCRAGLAIEKANDRGPVVLRDEGDQRLRQPSLVSQVDAVGDVLLEDSCGMLWVELIVDVVAAGLILDEGQRVGQLADIV